MNQREPHQNGIGQNGNKRKTPEEIEAEISQTRSVITEDINALGDKLSPDKLRESARGVLHDAKEEAKDFVRETKEAAVGSLRDAKDSAIDSLRSAKDTAVETVSETMHEISDQARRAGGVTARFVGDNAIPLSLIGIGVAWLTLGMRRRRAIQRDSLHESDYEYELLPYEGDYERPPSSVHLGETGGVSRRSRAGAARARVGEATHRASERLGNATEHARGRIGSAAARVADAGSELRSQAHDRAVELRERAVELGHGAQERLHRAQVGARDFAHDNPLAVGAVAIAAGVGVGLMLPTTRRENRLMGGTRARLTHEARDTVERVTSAAKDTAREVKAAITEQR